MAASLAAGVAAGLVVGKPVGFLLASYAAVKLGLAEKPAAYTWSQLGAAGALTLLNVAVAVFVSFL